MRPGAELALGAAVLALLGVGAAALGGRRARVGDSDPRRSTYLVGPSGASGFAQALEHLGVDVVRHRHAVTSLIRMDTAGMLLTELGPSAGLTPAEGIALAALPADLLLAGPSAASAMRCFGLDVIATHADSAPVHSAAGDDGLSPAWVRWVLRSRTTRTATDSNEIDGGPRRSCTTPDASATDTLLTAAGRPVVVRLALASGRTVTLVSDDRLFSNRTLRETSAGPSMLALVVPRYRRIVVDEYHHGYDASGSLAGATLAWTLGSPWGWALWQLFVVGLVALLASAVRFGPARHVIARRRRSPLEHVRALATALAAAQGHDVAVELIVQGLRRRLRGAGRLSREDARDWLQSLSPGVRTARGRDALGRLAAISAGSAAAADVAAAAEAVETLWEELKP